MPPENMHYHIRTNTGFSVICDYAETVDDCKEKMSKRVQMVKDLTGKKVKEETTYGFFFEGGIYVKWRPCIGEGCSIKSEHTRVK